jgi:hypothetical protein
VCVFGCSILPQIASGVDTLVLDENKGPFLPYKSDHVRCFWVHLVHMAYLMMP